MKPLPTVLVPLSRSEGSGPPLPFDVITDEGFVRFQQENWDWAVQWVYGKRGSSVRDELTANHVVQNAFGDLFAKRSDVRKNPQVALIGHLRNALRDHKDREIPVGSLGARSADSEIGIPLQGRYYSSPSSIIYAKQMSTHYAAAVTLLRPRVKEAFELKMKGLTLADAAWKLHLSTDAVEARYRTAVFFITIYLAKFEPNIAKIHAGIGRNRPIRTPRAARKAIDLLPIPSSKLVWMVYVSGVPVERAWWKAGCASESEAKDLLAQGLDMLSLLYSQNMPQDLVAALSINTPTREPDED